MRLNTVRISQHADRLIPQVLPWAFLMALAGVLGYAGTDDMAEQERAAAAYSERVCAGVHADIRKVRPDCTQVAAQ